MLNLAFPLIAPKIVARLERQREEPQENRDSPKGDSGGAPRGELAEKREAAAKKAMPASTAVCDEADRHVRVVPVIEALQARRRERRASNQREPKSAPA